MKNYSQQAVWKKHGRSAKFSIGCSLNISAKSENTFSKAVPSPSCQPVVIE
jgi:hypothetical protein